MRGEVFTGPIPKPKSRAAQKKASDRSKEKNWQRVRQAVLARDNHRCRFCGNQANEVHHLKPRSLGRVDAVNRCLVLCAEHHAERHAYRLFIIGDDANGRIRFERG